METTKTNEALLDSAKMAEKWFNDTNTAMMEIYNKQLSLTTGFFSNFINSTFGNNNGGGNGGQGFNTNFFGGNPIKWPWTPLNGGSENNASNPFFASFDKTYKQLFESNRNFFTEFSNQIKANESDWNLLNKEYKETIEKRFETSKKMLNSMSEAYSKQLNFSLDAEKNIIEEMNDQFNSMIKQNQKYWTDTLQTNQVPLNSVDKKYKEPTETETKKRSNVAVMA